jgi:hypothetical protein
VIFARRLGSALDPDLHFHALVLDGAVVSPSSALAPSFQPSAPLTDADVAALVEQLGWRISRHLERQGRLPRAHATVGDNDSAEHEAPLSARLCAASIQGGVALAPESPRPIARLDQRRSPRPAPLQGSLCADIDGFFLHAKVLVPAGELEWLEHLCRYIARPPIAKRRIALAPDGRVVYGLKRHWRDGTPAVFFDLLPFIERFAALVPPPRAHQLTYHGVLASASAWRDLIVPKRAPTPAAHSHGTAALHPPSSPTDRAQEFLSLALVALNMGGAPATYLRRRRLHMPALRRPASAHRAARRPGCRAQDPRASRAAHRAPTARAGSLP